jgi:hypothetical protein
VPRLWLGIYRDVDPLPLFAGAAVICSTRGLRADVPGGAVSGTAGLVSGTFDMNSASAAWRVARDHRREDVDVAVG